MSAVLKLEQGSTMNDECASRSGRTMNRMTPEMKVVHARLERWGKWAKSSGLRAWPSSTILARLIEQGPNAAASSSGAVSAPQDVLEVDAAVAHLGEVDTRVIRTYYLEWASIEVMARKRSMSVNQFEAVLRRARWRIEGYLRCLSVQSLKPA
jgi:DNA-directed RNA polymerase specialized sigma24 family protein